MLDEALIEELEALPVGDGKVLSGPEVLQQDLAAGIQAEFSSSPVLPSST